MSTVLVTGGSGYVGTTLTAALLQEGRQATTTMRSLQNERELRATVHRGQADQSGSEVVGAQLMADDGWAAAVTECEEVHTWPHR